MKRGGVSIPPDPDSGCWLCDDDGYQLPSGRDQLSNNFLFLHLLPIKTDLNTIFKSMATNDIAVCRTMCFADMTTVGTAPYNIAYHFIASILKAMASDTSIKSLQQLDVKLVVTIGEQLVGLWWNGYVNYFVLVSNNDTYVYVKQLGGNYHDDFYTDAKIKTAYKKYISTFVNRYKVSRHETTTS
ncbi:putative mannan endo-1 [Phytophthora citrophthora]|uniref:Mannan endo-1 n=1 Tax=Phytophthora citrophthora TaxID=4793 RepID=A0AAD9G0F3_9STRA|nr:putative mannan endo-1 [Phytophthora citrophthora]